MYTQGDGLWIKNAAEEERMVEAMRKAAEVTVKGCWCRCSSIAAHAAPVPASSASMAARRGLAALDAGLVLRDLPHPIGEVTAISYLAPLFGTLGGHLSAGRDGAAAALDGARRGLPRRHDHPAPDGGRAGHGPAVRPASAAQGLTAVLVKQLTAHDDPDKIVFLTKCCWLPLSLVPALFVSTWPTAAMLPALLGMGVCAVLGHIAWCAATR